MARDADLPVQRKHVVYLLGSDHEIFVGDAEQRTRLKAFEAVERKGESYLGVLGRRLEKAGLDEAGDLQGLNPVGTEQDGGMEEDPW